MSTMGFKEMADMIGKTVRVKVEGFTVPMTISDVKVAYGNKRLLVSPIGGSGEAWVDASRATTMSMSTTAATSRTARVPGRKASVTTKQETVQPTEAGKIRAWAKERGIHVNERGRIPEPVLNEYQKTQGGLASDTVQDSQKSDTSLIKFSDDMHSDDMQVAG